MSEWGNGWVNVTRQNPCPICGKPDWCSVKTEKFGGTGVRCCRASLAAPAPGEGRRVVGIDGRLFVNISKDAESATQYFIEFEERERQRAEYRKEKGLPERRTQKAGGTYHAGASMPYVRPGANPVRKAPEGCPIRSAEELDKVYSVYLSELNLSPMHMHYYKGEGWTATEILRSGMKSMQAKYAKDAKDYSSICRNIEAKLGQGCLRGVPGFYLDERGDWTVNAWSGPVLPVRDADGLIIRLRLRTDYRDLFLKDENDRFIRITEHGDYASFERSGRSFRITMRGIFDVTDGKPVKMRADDFGGKAKYRFITSWYSGRENAKFKLGTYASAEPGLYEIPGTDRSMVYLTEGEFKAQFASYRLKAPVVSVPGISNFEACFAKDGMVEKLLASGTRLFVICYDAEPGHENVRLYRKKLYERIRSVGAKTICAYWNPDEGKGIDDFLHNAGRMPTIWSGDPDELDALMFSLQGNREPA